MNKLLIIGLGILLALVGLCGCLLMWAALAWVGRALLRYVHF